jgi:hypothetical protein
MRYRLSPLVFGPHEIELSLDEFASIKDSKRNLLIALGVEEKLDLLLENYLEFEHQLLSIGTRRLVFGDGDWATGSEDRLAINRRLANLLTACRLYLDQVQHDVSSVYGRDAPQRERLKALMSHEYDGHLGYRVMESVRNWIQHQSLPVTRLHVHDTRREDLHRRIVTPYLDVKWIKGEAGFKSKVLAELEALGEKADLKPFVREYVDGIGRVHRGLRDLLAEAVSRSEQVITHAIDRFRRLHGEPVGGLAAMSIADGGTVAEEVQIFSDLIDRRRELASRFSLVGHLSSHYVSSEPYQARVPRGD